MNIIKEYEKISSNKVQGKSVEELLVLFGLVPQDQMSDALAEKAKSMRSTQEVLFERNLITEREWTRCLGIKYRLPVVDLSGQNISPRVLRYITEKHALDLQFGQL